jgi:hypothetical protein
VITRIITVILPAQELEVPVEQPAGDLAGPATVSWSPSGG